METSAADAGFTSYRATIAGGHTTGQDVLPSDDTNAVQAASEGITGAMESQNSAGSVCDTKEEGGQGVFWTESFPEVTDDNDSVDAVQSPVDDVTDTCHNVFREIMDKCGKTEEKTTHDNHDDDLQTDSPREDATVGHPLCSSHHSEVKHSLDLNDENHTDKTEKHLPGENQTFPLEDPDPSKASDAQRKPGEPHQTLSATEDRHAPQNISPKPTPQEDEEQDYTRNIAEDTDDRSIAQLEVRHPQSVERYAGGDIPHQLALPASQSLTTTSMQNMCANSQVTVGAESSVYVRTEAMVEAEEVLEDRGRVVLVGPPGCGKTTLAHALLRLSQSQGFIPYVFTDVSEWHQHVVRGKKCVVLMDALFGTVRVNVQQHDCWKKILTNVLELTRAGSCRLVITVYPHILRELQMLDGQTESPFVGEFSMVRLMESELDDDVKSSLINFHLNQLGLDPDIQSALVERTLQVDVSGPVFPWCCRQMVRNWLTLEDPAHVFTTPAEVYVPLLQQLSSERKQGPVFAAVLALTMKGKGNFLLKPQSFESDLLELGFSCFSADRMDECAHLLKGSILAENGSTFISRALYDAAGLSLGRSSRLLTSVRACDGEFLVKYVHTPGVEKMSSLVLKSDGQDVLVRRIYEEIVKHESMSVISQHPSFQSSEILDKLQKLCEPQRVSYMLQSQPQQPSLRELLRAVDKDHHFPLLYWSTLSPSPVLTSWCLTITKDKKRFWQYLPHVLLALALFHPRSQRYHQARALLQDMDISVARVFQFPTTSVLLPLPRPEHRVSEEVAVVIHSLADHFQSGGGDLPLCYLHTPSCPIPASVVSVRVREGEGVEVQVPDRQHWYPVLRLLTDRRVGEVDNQGRTLLHLAFEAGAVDMVSLNLKSQLEGRFSNSNIFLDLVLYFITTVCLLRDPGFALFRFIFRMLEKGFLFANYSAQRNNGSTFDAKYWENDSDGDDKEKDECDDFGEAK
ncbi:hypothetical protein ACOMHN_065860 [Nucella lapillus]